ncbi:hypothetical protein C9J85_06475 [Haloferax sp. wsp5]|nr:hypothetical protein C9J85_06475 [Haloferax sp. wsp5]
MTDSVSEAHARVSTRWSVATSACGTRKAAASKSAVSDLPREVVGVDLNPEQQAVATGVGT